MPDRLQDIRARLDAATPGPWADDYKSWCVWAPNHDLKEREDRCLVAEVGCGPDTDLIAHAPSDIAWLLDEVERLRTENGTELLPDEPVAQAVTKRERSGE